MEYNNTQERLFIHKYPVKSPNMNIPNTVRREIYKLVPNSLQNAITAFVFNENKTKYDTYPEIIVATKYGEIIECSNKLIQRSIEIDDHLMKEISVYKSNCKGKGRLYYIVGGATKLYVISTSEHLRIASFVNDFDRYEINDSNCTGIATLQVWARGNAVPLIFDDYKDVFIDDGYVDKFASQCDRFINEGRRNRNAMEYMVAQNEETLKKVVAMRHMLGFTSNTDLQDGGQSLTSSEMVSGDGPKDWMKVVHKNRKDIDNHRSVFIVKEKKPWIKQYHTNIILGVEIKNFSKSSSCDNVKMFLHHTTTERSVSNPLSYKTQMYVRDSLAPMSWRKKKNYELLPGETAILICVLKELDFEQSPVYNFQSFLEYELGDKKTLVSLEDVVVKGLDVVKGTFEMFTGIRELDELDFLTITGASEKTDLIVTIYNESSQSENDIIDSPTPISMSHILQTVLGFTQIDKEGNENLLGHCSSPHNPLFGVFLEISREESNENDLDVYKMILFTSSAKQIMILVNLIYDAIPSRIAITTNGLEVSKINIRHQEDQLSPIIGENRMETDQNDTKLFEDLAKVTKFGLSLSNQMSFLLEYFDLCMQSMAKSKSSNVVEKIGTEIDISAPGKDNFDNFMNKFDKEALNGCNIFYNDNVQGVQ